MGFHFSFFFLNLWCYDLPNLHIPAKASPPPNSTFVAFAPTIQDFIILSLPLQVMLIVEHLPCTMWCVHNLDSISVLRAFGPYSPNEKTFDEYTKIIKEEVSWKKRVAYMIDVYYICISLRKVACTSPCNNIPYKIWKIGILCDQ